MNSELRRRGGRMVVAALLGWAIGCLPGQVQGQVLVPYRGTIQGVLTVDGEGQVTAEPAQKLSSHLGKGIQTYETLAVSLTEQGLLCAEGCSRSLAANGDELRIWFELVECPTEAGVLEPGEIEYVGSYTVIAGGTGRFVYDPTIEADWGHGELAGRATIQATPSGMQISFRHGFSGTLCVGWNVAPREDESGQD